MNRLVAAGKLDRRVRIDRATATRDAHNEETLTWAEHATRWASVKPAPGTERFRSAETAAEAPMRFVFRWEAGLVGVEDLLVHDGRTYEISSVTEIGRRDGWEVLADARAE